MSPPPPPPPPRQPPPRPSPPHVPPAACYRHPDRRAGVTCQRCSRPICPSCMVQASVGFHCPECVKSGGQRVRDVHSLLAGARPYVTVGLMVVNVTVFFADASTGHAMLDGGELLGRAFDPQLGRVGVAYGEWYRVLTSGFLHVGILHVGVNMLSLWFLGSQLEAILGHERFTALYFSSLLAGSLGQLLWDPTVPAVGASGAIFGLLGVAVVFQRSRGIDVWRSGLGAILLLNLFFTFSMSGIGVGAHVGGLVGGLVAGFAIFEIEKRTSSVWPAVASTVALGLLFAVGAVLAGESLSRPLF